MGYAKNITELIGNTPLVQLQQASNESGATVLGKCEFLNPTHSVKDRIGTNMINTALKEGLINKDTIVIEPTSGNTGIALASVCAALGIKLILTMPASMSIERRRLLQALGAKLVLTPPEKGMKGAIEKANELKEETPNSFIPQQFANKANPEIHRLTTAQEILKDTDGKIDIFIAAVGTGGTLTGTGEVLKAHNPNIKIIAVEPEASPVLSGGNPGPHKIQGIGAGFVPDILNTKIYDEIIQVSNDAAIETSRQLAQNEGLLVGISAGANAYVASQVAARPENKGKTIVTILCDTGERYLSSGLYNYEEE
ncbi:cysteine synthase A [Aliarcobacter butzleri]|jgi:cysteine synthase A|uniref:Cysteine synthase n=124 Tax=Arcobacteraceae TaxID=2808963 RepID=A8EWR2_ALIB4|nr:cysteine synthase A [Aliarcobacter butzleri]ABV68385.1 cysteine synthase [Aliarcobacter butzleri RM4018]ABV68507.1 cysteine synthase [Aliarcobacter butzleri RM4018]AGR78345.1 cysteine synthase A [Aliarcobacter butzleri 7h1h]AGR78498.1 cysteine synthase A [Aliarcobacter butzleri 7h1h]KLD97151.1 cysteine synthase [Aliarcobacter butzleri L348]